jgi:hypothetical protein
MATDSTRPSPESVRPPRWAEAVLRLLLRRDDAETVSGDLLEEYRETVLPSRGRGRADAWFVSQVAGFVWRSAWLWAVLFAALFMARTALDWFVPPVDFITRSLVTTYAAAGVFVAAGFWTARRSRSIRGSALAGFATAAIAAALSAGGALVLLAISHDARTWWAIDHSGGLGEVFVLPVFAVVPGTLLATIGGAAGKLLHLRRAG